MQKKAYLIWCLVVALALSSWTITTAMGASAPSKPDQNTNHCNSATNNLVGNLAALPKVIYRVRLMCNFDVRMGELNKVSDLDRRFITASIASNMLEIQTLNYALGQAQNEEWRGLIQMMIIQHTEDLNMAMKIAKKIGANTSPDLTNMRVLPWHPGLRSGHPQGGSGGKVPQPLNECRRDTHYSHRNWRPHRDDRYGNGDRNHRYDDTLRHTYAWRD